MPGSFGNAKNKSHETLQQAQVCRIVSVSVSCLHVACERYQPSVSGTQSLSC
uniref:Uncharacterized protein n=1 Tax=Anguilla anguilla TaxID=7936 RepID=A0A0E9PCG8_ANGAN